MDSIFIEKFHGDTLVLSVAVKNDDDTPRSLVGATIRFKLDDITESTPGVVITRSDALGTFIITVSSTLMAALEVGNYQFDVVLIDVSQVRETLFLGSLSLLEGLSA